MRRKKENKTDAIVATIVQQKTTFEEYFGNKGSVPIFSNPRYTTPIFPNIPWPITGRFTQPDPASGPRPAVDIPLQSSDGKTEPRVTLGPEQVQVTTEIISTRETKKKV